MQNRDREKPAYLTCGTIFILCFLLTSSTSFEWQIHSENNTFVIFTGNNETLPNSAEFPNYLQSIYYLQNTELGENPVYRLVFYWFNIIAFVAAPFLILVISNILTFRSLRMSRREREKLTNAFSARRAQQVSKYSFLNLILLISKKPNDVVCENII